MDSVITVPSEEATAVIDKTSTRNVAVQGADAGVEPDGPIGHGAESYVDKVAAPPQSQGPAKRVRFSPLNRSIAVEQPQQTDLLARVTLAQGLG